MANKSLFRSAAPPKAPFSPKADTVNEAGGVAYSLENRAALAQLVSTGCFNNTYYVSGEDQLKKVLELANKVDTEFLAKVAVFSREQGYMKDAPALLAAVLTTRGPDGRRYLKKIFNRVIDNGKMLRNFVQILRSGQVGRKSLGSFPKGLVRAWFESQTDDRLFKNSVGNDPSMADVIKMIHPRPNTKSREALYAYLIGKAKNNFEYLPGLVQRYELFKKGEGELPEVPFEMLTALPLTESQWKDLAQNLSWTQLRMNLNTLQRHNVFTDRRLVSVLAAKLADPELIRKAKVFPYQLMAAYMHADEQLPMLLREALQSALDTSLENIPTINGRVGVFPDHSGSMDSPITGHRVGATSKVTCKMVAALVAAAYLRKNPDTLVLPFAERVSTVRLNPRDSVMTNAKILAGLPNGGTKCSAPLEWIAQHGEQVDLAVFVSDNESWIGSAPGWWSDRPTAVLAAWDKVRKVNKGARLACIDIQPNTSTQAPDRKDILNIGGFSDRVFDIVSLFHKDELEGGHWVGVIKGIEL